MDDRLHEVRNSLSGIATAADLLRTRDDVPVDRAKALLEMIASEAARLERLVAGRSRPQPRQVSLDDVLEPLVLSRRTAGQRVAWNSCGHRVYGDPDAISECLNILLVNAAQHAAGSDVHVSADASQPMVRIRVSDDGPGIAPHLGETLFLRGIRDQQSAGQGLGLSIARELMLAQGGNIRLVYIPGSSGATFEITVPACVLEPAA